VRVRLVIRWTFIAADGFIEDGFIVGEGLRWVFALAAW
jgi:hypothetical protein